MVYGAYVYLSSTNIGPIEAKPLNEQQDISHVYNNIAKTYDKEIGTSEFFMGMPLLRRAMAKRAQVSSCVPIFTQPIQYNPPELGSHQPNVHMAPRRDVLHSYLSLGVFVFKPQILPGELHLY